jgi:hypothetical protein
MKAQQSSKIKEIGEALVAAGFHALDEQADVLGLSRSTTWTILKRNHKKTGLSVGLIPNSPNLVGGEGLEPLAIRCVPMPYPQDDSSDLRV